MTQWERDLMRREAELRGAGHDNLYAGIIRSTNQMRRWRRFLDATILFCAGAILGCMIVVLLIMAGAL